MNIFIYELRQIPFLRILLAFIFGILFQIYLAVPLTFVFSAASVSGLILIVLQIKKTTAFQFNYKWLYGVWFFIFIFCCGIASTSLRSKVTVLPDDPFMRYSARARVVSAPKETQKAVKAILEIEFAQSDSLKRPEIGKVLAFFEKDTLALHLKFGDVIYLQTNIRPITNPGNPDEFDYKRYMAIQEVYNQAYINSGKWKIIKEKPEFSIYSVANNLRKSLLEIYQKTGLVDEEYAVVAALTLGYTDDLEPETKQAFSATGTMHILSVSGLHVGILYIMLDSLLKFLKKRPSGLLLHGFICISFLWFFALLSGLSPSVQRSALMFSFVIIALNIDKKANIYNTLAASAFFLLLINPYNILDVGFQLSYIALLSIVAIQPLMKHWYKPRNVIVKYCWELGLVSIAAQIGTVPIGLYYFHQFPNYFMFANMVAIPLSTLIMYLSAILLSVSTVPYLGALVAKLLIYCTEFFNWFLRLLESLPFALIKNVSISFPSLLIIYVCLIVALVFIVYRRFAYLRLWLFCALGWSLFSGFENFQNHKSKQLWIYNIKNIPAYSYFNGNEHVFLTDTSLLHTNTKLEYYLRNHWIKMQLPIAQLRSLRDIAGVAEHSKTAACKSEVFAIQNKIFYLVSNTDLKNKSTSTKMKVDYLILNSNAKVDIADLLRLFVAKLIVIDSSNFRSRREYWIKQCQQLNVAYYSVAEMGALKIEF